MERGVLRMLKTYQGYFREGRFISPELVTIPNDIRVHVTIIDEPITDDVRRKQRAETLEKMFIRIQESKSDLADEEWDELANIRSQSDFSREINL